MPRGDRTAIMQYLVPQYDLQTQKKIGAILRSLDDKIELNNKINENLERQARAIFYEWFISTPQKTDIVQTEFGMLPTSCIRFSSRYGEIQGQMIFSATIILTISVREHGEYRRQAMTGRSRMT